MDATPLSDDIQPLLTEWPYRADEELMVRQVLGPDGRPRLQLRLELGLLEMRCTGRPDGLEPFGQASLLDYWQGLAAAEDEDTNQDDSFKMDRAECHEVQREATQFYHRRLAWMRLGEFARAAEDARHNLAIMDLLRERAADRQDWLNSEQHRAFVLSHLTKALAFDHLSRSEQPEALAAIEDGIANIETIFREIYGRPELVDEDRELATLQELRSALSGSRPIELKVGPAGETLALERRLLQAVEAEDFELAARLRDELNRLQAEC